MTPSQVPPEVRATLAELGGWNQAFLDHHAAACPTPAELPSWPVFIAPGCLAELVQGAIALTRMIKEVPRRVFGDDLAALAAFYGLPGPELAALLLEEPTGIPGALARLDLLWGPAGPRVLEVNLGSLGGLEVTSTLSDYLARPAIGSFLARQPGPPSSTETLRALLDHVVADNRAITGPAEGEWNVGFVVEPGSPYLALDERTLAPLHSHLASLLAAQVPPCRGTLVISTPDRVRDDGTGLRLDGLAVRALVELTPIDRQAAFRYWKGGRLTLYNGPVATLLADKRNLAWLSELADGARLDPDEISLVRRFVPWTRTVRSGPVERAGRRFSLPEYVAANREELVLKPARSGQGHGVTVGAGTSRDDWHRTLRTALGAGDWIVQERVVSKPYWGRVGDGWGPADIVWGVFVFGSRYGGTFLRALPSGTRSAINTSLGASEAYLLEEPPS